jgi:hypothetical protein
MKKQLTLLITFIFFITSFIGHSQSVNVLGGNSETRGDMFEMSSIIKSKKDNSEEFKKISHKMYLTKNFITAKIDSLNETYFLKYNIYKDEMEFSKNEKIYYLTKKKGREVLFTDDNIKYKVINYKNKLSYFVLLNDGKNQLLLKEIIKFKEAKLATSSYDKSTPSDFKRKKDKLYIKLGNSDIKEIPSNKKKFYALFKEESKSIKSFIKKNKIDIKKTNDLKKIINYLNKI